MTILQFKVFLREFKSFGVPAHGQTPNRSDKCSYTELDESYDRGRDFAHKVTLRYFEE